MKRTLLLGFLISCAALLVVAQVGNETKKGGKKGPAPLSTTAYDVGTMEQLAKPGNLGNYGNHSWSVQRREVGAAPDSHHNFSGVPILTSGSGSVKQHGALVDVADETKIVLVVDISK